MTFSIVFTWMKMVVPIQVSLKYISMSPINSKLALVQVMAWRRAGDKPLPELMMTQLIHAYVRQKGRWVTGIDTKIEVSPTTWEAHPRANPEVTKIEVSISIQSWCLKAYHIYADSGVYTQKIAHKNASNQPLWKAWPQTIVTSTSVVTSW